MPAAVPDPGRMSDTRYPHSRRAGFPSVSLRQAKRLQTTSQCGGRGGCRFGRVERFSALNDHAVVRAFQGNTHRGEFVYHDIKTVRFFDFQLLRIPDHGCTVRCGGKNRDDRDFIDQGRDQFALDDGAGKRRRIAHEKVCNRFSAGVLLIQKCDVSTHGAADAEHTVAGRLMPTFFRSTSEPGTISAAAMK